MLAFESQLETVRKKVLSLKRRYHNFIKIDLLGLILYLVNVNEIQRFGGFIWEVSQAPIN